MLTYRLFFVVSALLVGCAGPITITGPGSYYLQANKTDVHLGAARSAKVTNRIYRQQRVDVFEIEGSWARISKYYDGRIEGVSGPVARWIPANLLALERPRDLDQPERPKDPRINGLPKVGEDGLTKKDVDTLYRGAQHFLRSGRCQKVEFGDKSTSRRNTYYVNCGGPQNLFFREQDLPDDGHASR